MDDALECCAAFQRVLYSVENWGKGTLWSSTMGNEKSFWEGTTNPMHQYGLGSSSLESSSI